MLDNLEEVRVFVQVVESGGFSAAGRALHLATNLVSRRVARLEGRLGTRLLHRTTRSVSLTEEGRTFRERALPLLAAADDAAASVAGRTRGLAGTVRVALRSTSIEYGFVEDLVRLLEGHPALRVQLVVHDGALDLVAEAVDLAVQVGELPDSSLVTRRVGEVPIVLAASPRYLERRGRPRQPGELVEHECIRRLARTPEETWTLVGPDGREVVARIGGRLECSDSAAQTRALHAGFGIGLRPSGEVRRATRAGVLARVLPSYAVAPVPVRVVMPPRRARLAPVEVMVELVRTFVHRLS